MAGGDWFNELCSRTTGELDESKLIEKSLQVLAKYLNIKEDPTFMKISVLKVSNNFSITFSKIFLSSKLIFISRTVYHNIALAII